MEIYSETSHALHSLVPLLLVPCCDSQLIENEKSIAYSVTDFPNSFPNSIFERILFFDCRDSGVNIKRRLCQIYYTFMQLVIIKYYILICIWQLCYGKCLKEPGEVTESDQ